MMKKIITAVLLCAALGGVSSCFLPFNEISAAKKSGSAGTLTVNIADTPEANAGPRTVVPGLLGISGLTLTVKLTDSMGVVHELGGIPTATATLPNVFYGPITVTVDAYNASSVKIAAGSASMIFSPGGSSSIAVKLTLAAPAGIGNGGFSLEISWPRSVGANYVVGILDTGSMYLPAIISGTVKNSAIISAGGIIQGAHTLKIFFYNDFSKSTSFGVFTEEVNIYNGFISNKWIGLDGSTQDKRAFTLEDFASSATEANLTFILGSTTQNVAFSKTGRTQFLIDPLTTESALTLCIGEGVEGQTVEYKLNAPSSFEPIKAGSPVNLPLTIGRNTISIQVTPPDLVNSVIYTATVNRKSGAAIIPIYGGAISSAGFKGYFTDLSANYELLGDLVISDSAPIYQIGYSGGGVHEFTGTFNGNDHTITGLNIEGAYNEQGCGLFGATFPETVIRNVSLKNITVHQSNVDNGGYYNGSLVGRNSGVIYRCGVSGSVSVDSGIGAGGFVGANEESGVIQECYSVANVISGGTYVGGLVGRNYSLIENCYARGSVKGYEFVGGLVGYNFLKGCILTSFSTGLVAASSNGGGLVGLNNGVIQLAPSCYYDSNTSQMNDNGTGGVGRTTTEMKGAVFPLWDTSLWGSDAAINTGYPYLKYFGAQTMIPPVQMSSADLRAAITGAPGGNYIMTDDIELTDNWIPIDIASPYYQGTFDGDGHTIFNMKIPIVTFNRGFISVIGGGGIVKNVTLESVRISNSEECTSAGGIVGRNEGTVDNCSVTGSISASQHSGGLAGENTGIISRCWAAVQVTADNNSAGGLVGQNGGTVQNCFALGKITGYASVGGLVGESWTDSIIINSYATGNISGTGNLGGLVGLNLSPTTITYSYYDKGTSGMSDSGKGLGLNTVAMKIPANFIGWNFTDRWGISPAINNGYPYLR